MKAAITAAIPALSCLAGCGSPAGQGSTPRAPAPLRSGASAHDAPEGEIVTDQVVKMNSAGYARPPRSFRPGAVTPRTAPVAQRTPTGFSVKFESSASVTTPTVYERAVIVSGGFGSSELYAFDTTTGASLWAIDLNDDGPSSPACERGVCVVSTESCTLFAIAAATGKPLWSHWLGDPLTSSPAIAGDRVFASYPVTETETETEARPRPPGATHALAAFELRTGKILWQLWLESDVMSAPVAVGEFLYVTTFTGTVIKLEQATGKVRYAMRARATSAPVVLFDGGVEQLYYTRRADEAPGGELERGPAAGAPDQPAAGAEEMLIRADHNEPKTRYEAAKRKARYLDKDVQRDTAHAAKSSSEDSGNGFSGGAPVAAAAQYALANVGIASVSSMQGFQGSRIVKLEDRSVNTMGDEVIATDSETGKALWSYKLAGNLAEQGGFLGTAPLAAGGSILVGTLQGDVVRLDQRSGRLIAKYAVGAPVRSQPVVAKGWIYVGTDDGRLVAIDTKDPSVTGWSTWGGDAQRTGVQR
jgi:outer membrane protein assembly factor BamB